MFAVRLHVRFDLVGSQLRARDLLPARVADERREVSDDQRHVVTACRKALEAIQHDHEAKVEVGARWIDAEFHVERSPERQTRSKLFDGFDVLEAVEEILGVVKVRWLHFRSMIVTPCEPSSSLPYRRLATAGWPRRKS